MLAQVVLKAYAVALILFLLLPQLLLRILTLQSILENIPVWIMTTFVAVVLFRISKGLSMHQAWAKMSAYTVFIVSAAITIPMFTQSRVGKCSYEYFWIPLWLTAMSSLGLASLIFPTIHRIRNIEPAAPGNREQAPGS